jgi:hypothetical protein
MDTTLKIKLTGRTEVDNGEQVQLHFQPDYDDERNKAWAKYTPALSLSFTVRSDAAAASFEVGDTFTATLSKD